VITIIHVKPSDSEPIVHIVNKGSAQEEVHLVWPSGMIIQIPTKHWLAAIKAYTEGDFAQPPRV